MLQWGYGICVSQWFSNFLSQLDAPLVSLIKELSIITAVTVVLGIKSYESRFSLGEIKRAR